MTLALINAPTDFMYLMSKVFVEYVDPFLDDILIYSKDEDEHTKHLHLVPQKLKEHQLYARLSKCEFWLKQVPFRPCYFRTRYIGRPEQD
jgi:hypothetical protein